MYQDSCILITGGTGTIGSAFVKHCLNNGAAEVRILSRSREKQYDLVHELNDSRVCCYTGDVNDKNSVERAMREVDFVLHAAANKYVPMCEEIPLDAIRTNTIGSFNVIDSAINNNVKKIVCISTDKAVYPTSTMGYTKALMEKIALQKARDQDTSHICIARLCNLIISNGSVVPLFFKKALTQKPLTLTDPEMLRYFISTKQVVNLIDDTFKYGLNGDIFIPKGKLCTIGNLAKAIIKLLNLTEDYPINFTGARPGEKKTEELFTQQEVERIIELNDNFIVSNSLIGEFNFNFCQASVDELVDFLKEEMYTNNL